MTSLRSLVRQSDSGTPSSAARRIAIALAVLTPLLIAGVAVTAVSSTPGGSTASSATTGSTGTAASVAAPTLPAAVVNQDEPAYTTPGDDSTAVLAGKVVVSELTSGTSGQGFRWDVTDADTASAGLTSGQYAAVVTIPSSFSAALISTSGDSPTQAQLQVQTNGANSYVTELLATALSSDLPAALAEQSTTTFVSTTLGAFTTLNTQIGEAAGGAGKLAGGADLLAKGASDLTGVLGQATTGANDIAKGAAGLKDALALAAPAAAAVNIGAEGLSAGLADITAATTDLPVYADLLAVGSSGVTAGIGVLKDRLAEETAKSYAIDDRQKALEASIAELRDDVPTLTPEEVQARLDSLSEEAAGIRVSSFEVTLGLGFDALGGTALEDVSGLVSQGQAQFAADVPQLTGGIALAAGGAALVATGTGGISTGIDKLATGSADLSTAVTGLADGLGKITTGSGELATNLVPLATNTHLLANGLGEAAEKIPSYTADQQKTLAGVVATPIVTTQSDVAALPSPAAAIGAVAVPLALWIGAFAIYLVLLPFTRRALASTASSFAIVLGALVPAAILAVIQAAVVALVFLVSGAQPAHVVGSILFAFVMSLAFVMLHQGLVALFGQAGRLLSLALVVVQVAAAAVILPVGLSSPLYTGLAGVLPLSHAITGMQALIGGGSLGVVVQETIVLAVVAAIGFVLALIAAVRARSRSVIAPSPVVLPATPAPTSRGAVTA